MIFIRTLQQIYWTVPSYKSLALLSLRWPCGFQKKTPTANDMATLWNLQSYFFIKNFLLPLQFICWPLTVMN